MLFRPSQSVNPEGAPLGQGLDAMARAGAESKALILLVTFFPQCVVSMLSMTPPIMVGQIALSLGFSSQIAGIYIGLVYNPVPGLTRSA